LSLVEINGDLTHITLPSRLDINSDSLHLLGSPVLRLLDLMVSSRDMGSIDLAGIGGMRVLRAAGTAIKSTREVDEVVGVDQFTIA